MQSTLLNVDDIKMLIHTTFDRDSYIVKGKVSLLVWFEFDESVQSMTDDQIKQAFIDRMTKALQAT